MSEVRCPMCGKENPSELDVCQYCEARLKPLIVPSESETEDLKKGEPVRSVTDWLDSLSDEDEGETSPGSSEGQEDAGELQSTPQNGGDDWLSSLRNEGDVDEGETDEADDEAEWPEFEEDQESGIPDWLSNLGKEGDFSAAPDALREEEPQEEVESDTSAQPFVSDEESDTLGAIGDDEPTEEELEEHGIPSEEIEFEESLISSFDSSVEGAAPQEIFDEESVDLSPAESEEVQEDEFPSIEADGEIGPLDEDGTPEWLADIIEEEPVPATEPEIETETEQVPEWLDEIVDSSDLEEIDFSAAELETDSEYDWLEDEGEPEEPVPGSETEGDMEVVPPFMLDEEVSEVVPGEDVPDWLADIPQIETSTEPPVVEEETEGLEQAELPSWLESMRPVEAAAPEIQFTDEGELETESSGPLAGLRGVLPVEPEIAQIKKPSTYALKLQVSDQQRAHANLFDELIKNEGESAPVDKGAVISPQIILRVVIFILLLAAVVWPIYTGSQDVPLTEMPVETFETSRLINSLTVGEPVLLAVDYEPGYSGELEAASATVLDNLMIRGAYLAIVSTSPSGPALAERLVKTVNMEGGHDYQPGSQYRNLGFIPGGASGLQAFAQTPQQVLKNGIDGQPVWNVPPLDSIGQLSDFSHLVLLTESPETGRAWIEQVQPSLGDAGLIMVISAQAEPLIRPYFEDPAKQVQGLVTGLAGGAMYESGMPRPILARKYWDAFSYSLIVAVLIIIFGSAINTISAYVMNRRPDGRKSTG